MTPKEKAVEIIRKFFDYAADSASDKSYSGEYYGKQCAIYMVNEMIAELNELPRIPYNERRTEYWRAVKSEIENL